MAETSHAPARATAGTKTADEPRAAASADGRMLPTFLVAGAQKGGTTWLYECLREHPGICMPATKELFFFDRYYERGLGWYEGYFEGCGAAAARGEVTPTYLTSPAAAERIRETLPGVRLVFCLRDPVERAFSMYLHHWRKGDTRQPFEQALEDIPSLKADGLYHAHLGRFLELFPRAAVLVLLYEDVLADPRAELRRLYGFLGVEPGFRPAALGRRYHERAAPRGYLLAKAANALSRSLHRHGLHAVMETLKRHNVQRLVYRADDAALPPRPGADVRARLAAYYAEDMVALGRLLGRSDLGRLWAQTADREPADRPVHASAAPQGD